MLDGTPEVARRRLQTKWVRTGIREGTAMLQTKTVWIPADLDVPNPIIRR